MQTFFFVRRERERERGMAEGMEHEVNLIREGEGMRVGARDTEAVICPGLPLNSKASKKQAEAKNNKKNVVLYNDSI